MSLWQRGLPVVVVGLTVAACGTAPVAVPVEGDHGRTYRLLSTEEVPVAGVSADSQSMAPANMTDGNLNTAWSNGGYRNATAWAALRFAGSASLASVGIKTGPSPAGTSYDLQVSEDGASWRTVLAGQTNGGWNVETKLLPAGTSGTYLRVLWHNSASNPQPHFAIYELFANGAAGPAPSPTPTAAPSATPSPQPSSGSLPPDPAGQQLIIGGTYWQHPVELTASSSYGSLLPARAADLDQNTQWAGGGYQDAEDTLTARFEAAWRFHHVDLKTGALPAGVSYTFETSQDGASWTASPGSHTNTTWGMETKYVAGEGRYLRVRFHNSTSAPLARFQVYELAVYSSDQVATSPNQPPVITRFDQGTGSLNVQAHDPDGDPLAYTWTVQTGDIVLSNGTHVKSTTTYGVGSVDYAGAPDDQLTLSISDQRGGVVTQTYALN